MVITNEGVHSAAVAAPSLRAAAVLAAASPNPPRRRSTALVREFEAQASRAPAGQSANGLPAGAAAAQEFYVHLPLKRAMHACDPVQRLRLLRNRHSGMSDRRFHDEMIDIVSSVRDLHTNYVLPRPYKGKVAVQLLPRTS
jgi:hypothetical protein